MVALAGMVLLLYDIPDDRVRGQVADTCLDYGLDRIQYSAFTGPLSRTHHEELMLKLRGRLGRKPGYIQSFRLCPTDWAARQSLGKPVVRSAVPEAVVMKGTPDD